MSYIPAEGESIICEAMACPFIVGLAVVVPMARLLVVEAAVIDVAVVEGLKDIPGVSAMMIVAMVHLRSPHYYSRKGPIETSGQFLMRDLRRLVPSVISLPISQTANQCHMGLSSFSIMDS